MDAAAKAYVRALENRRATRRHPPLDALELQNRVGEYTGRIRASRDELERAVRARMSPSRAGVTRTAREGVYVFSSKKNGGGGGNASRVLVRYGIDGPSVAFWNVAKNSPVYLRAYSSGEWKNAYSTNTSSTGRLDEHWSPRGLR